MTHDTHATTGRTDPTLTVIALLLAAYAAAVLAGWPQHGRDLLVAAQAAHAHPDAEAGQHGAAHDAHAHANRALQATPPAILPDAFAGDRHTIGQDASVDPSAEASGEELGAGSLAPRRRLLATSWAVSFNVVVPLTTTGASSA